MKIRSGAAAAFVLAAVQAPLNGADFWFHAPELPAYSAQARLSELRVRRERVMKAMGPGSIMLLFAAEPKVYAADIDYPYREENNFYYLTGIEQTGAILLLAPGASEGAEVVFLPTIPRRRQVFNGTVASPEVVTEKSGIRNVQPMADLVNLLGQIAKEAVSSIPIEGAAPAAAPEQIKRWRTQYEALIAAAKKEQANFYVFLPSGPLSIEYRREQALAQAMASVSNGFTVRDANPILRALRDIKSEREIDLLQHAVDITHEAFQHMYSMLDGGIHEYDIQAEFDSTFEKHDSHWGYPNIIAAGVNATTMHYVDDHAELKTGELLLIDAADEFDHYSADVTRTMPVSGRFSPEQAEIYRLVYAAQQAGLQGARAGGSSGGYNEFAPDSIQGRAVAVVKDGLLKMGLITSKEGDQYKTWFLHGISHQLGMNVHDLFHPGTNLAPGMVITVEPGVYIRPDALDTLDKTPENGKFIAAVRPAFEKYKGIGVRIEDDVLITDEAPRVLSAAIPSKLEDVEQAIVAAHRLAASHATH